MMARPIPLPIDPAYLARRRAESRRIVCVDGPDDVPPDTLMDTAWRFLRQHGASDRPTPSPAGRGAA